MKKKIICLFMGAMFLVGCGGIVESTVENTDGVATTEVTDEEDASELSSTNYTLTAIDTDGYAMTEDTAEIEDAYTKYTEAVSNTQNMHNYTVTTKIVANQQSDDTNYCIDSLDLIEILVDNTTDGAEQLKSTTSYSDSTMDSALDATVYYRDKTVYYNEGDLKLKVENQDYTTMDPTYADVINGITFETNAIISAGEADGVGVFVLDPSLVTFSNTYAVPTDEMETLVLEYEIQDNLVVNSTFNYTVKTNTATIQENTGVETEEAEAEGATQSDVTFDYSVNTLYTDIGKTVIDYPDFSDYKTEEELTAEQSTEQSTESVE